jgi:pimeloyl-ACP methyl ester carboxylesterase
MGGHIGLILTLAHPELVHSLVLTGSSGFTKEVLEKLSQEEETEII